MRLLRIATAVAAFGLMHVLAPAPAYANLEMLDVTLMATWSSQPGADPGSGTVSGTGTTVSAGLLAPAGSDVTAGLGTATVTGTWTGTAAEGTARLNLSFTDTQVLSGGFRVQSAVLDIMWVEGIGVVSGFGAGANIRGTYIPSWSPVSRRVPPIGAAPLDLALLTFDAGLVPATIP